VSDRVTKPIKELQNKMQTAARGNLEVRFHSPRRDEISDLGDSFNIMIVRIEDLMVQAKREQINLKKAELRALQSQIKPHFLYNTLDSIIWMSQASRNDALITMVKALSEFFRLGLNNGREIVTVAEEVEHTTSYLVIQRMRYADILDYEFAVDTDLAPLKMIKLTLQPLIENAIYHGLKNKRGGGKIWINGELSADGECVVFTVRDNGRGMSRARLLEVRQDVMKSIGDETGGNSNVDINIDGGGYALRNVRERMRLFYGARSDLTIESKENEGATVKMIFPALRRDHD
jgi:two-component system sensor histidine kinase YesM